MKQVRGGEQVCESLLRASALPGLAKNGWMKV